MFETTAWFCYRSFKYYRLNETFARQWDNIGLLDNTVLTGSLLIKKEMLAAGMDSGLMHSTFSFIPGLYRRFSPYIDGPSFGNTEKKS